MVKRGLIVCVLFLLLIGVVSAGVEITYPVDGVSYGSKITRIDLNVSGTNLTNCWWNDGNSNNPFACNNSMISGIMSDENWNTWTVYSNNTDGEVNNKSITFWVDSIAPNLTVLTPLEISYTKEDYFYFEAFLFEINKGLYSSSPLMLKIWLPSDPINYLSRRYLDLNSNNETNWTENLAGGDQEEGNYNFTIFAKDIYPNGTTIREVSQTGVIIRDTTPPYLTSSQISSSVFSPANSDGFLDSVNIIMNASELIQHWNTTYIYNSTGNPVFRKNKEADYNEYSMSIIWDGKYKYYSPIGDYVPDGVYTINTTITDRAGNVATVYVGNITIDNTAPTITLVNTTPITFEVFEDYIEYGATTDDASVVVTDNSNVNMSKIGIYNVTYNSNDSVLNQATEITRTINVVDTTAPTITLNGSNSITLELGSTYIESGATANDIYDGDLTSNIVIDNSSLNMSIVGSYNITYNVNDSSNNSADEKIRTISVQDSTPPTITPLSPPDNKAFTFSENNVQLNYSYSDLSSLNNCSLILNDVLNQSGTSNFTLTNLSSGAYSWQVACNDSYTNQGISSTQYFTILSNLTELSEFSEYTDLTDELNISNVLYFFVNRTYGRINFTEAIDFSSGFDWTNFISISGNKIYVNSTGQPELNKSATITFYNVTLTDPEVFKDDISFCHSTSCPGYSYSGNILTFTVIGFSEYTLREYIAPVVSTSSSSSGGGGSTTYWTCAEWGEWSECVDDEQTRICNVKERATYSTSIGLTETRTCDGTVLLSSEELGTTPQEEIIGEESTKSFLGITGAAITDLAGTGRGKLSIAFVILLFIGGIGFIVYRRRKVMNNVLR